MNVGSPEKCAAHKENVPLGTTQVTTKEKGKRQMNGSTKSASNDVKGETSEDAPDMTIRKGVAGSDDDGGKNTSSDGPTE
jgi:hypothetical protein